MLAASAVITTLENTLLPTPSLAAAAVSATIPTLEVLLLCLLAGVGTLLLMPSGRDKVWTRLGGILGCLAIGLLLVALVRAAEAITGGDIYFYTFSVLAIVSAIRVITHAKPIYSALYFIVTVLATAGLLILLGADFPAVALVLIYAGAILVTYLFVIMLASQPHLEACGQVAGEACDTRAREPGVAVALAFALLALLLRVILEPANVPVPIAASKVDKSLTATQGLARVLFTDEVASLEMAGILLLVAMVGAVLIAGRRWPGAAEEHAAANIGNDDPHDIPVTGSRSTHRPTT